MNALPTWTDFALFAAGFVSWAVSTLAAGGGSVLIVFAIAMILQGQSVVADRSNARSTSAQFERGPDIVGGRQRTARVAVGTFRSYSPIDKGPRSDVYLRQVEFVP